MDTRWSLPMVLILLLSGLSGAGLVGPAGAQAQINPRSVQALGTGGGMAAVGVPTSAMYANPAHLGAGRGGPTLEIRLLDVRGLVGGDLLQFDHYADTFGHRAGTLSDAEERAVLDDWFGGAQRRVTSSVEVVPIAVAYRPPDGRWAFGAGVRAQAQSEAAMNRGLFDLLLVGADSNRTVPVNGRQRTVGTVDVTASISYTFEALPLSIGVSPRLLLGTTYADATLASTVTVADSVLTHRFDYTARAAGGLSREVYDTFDPFSGTPFGSVTGVGGTRVSGTGVGIDIGATYAVQPDFFVSASVTDLGTIRWTREAQTVTPENSTFRFEGLEMNADRLQDEFEGDVGAYAEQQVDSLARAAYEDVTRDRSSFSTSRPAALHVGSTWTRTAVTLNGGVTVRLTEGAGARRPSPAAHLGGEVRLGPVPLRAGVRVGGSHAVTLAGGIGLDVGSYRFDLGVNATPSTSTVGAGARYAVGLSVATVRF